MTDDLGVSYMTETQNGTVVFAVRGCLDIATTPSVKGALVEATGEGKRDVIVDLTNLEFLDSTGLSALIGAQRRSQEHGASIRVVVREGPIQRLFNITGLVRVFAVYHTLAAALKDEDRLAAL